MKVFISWSGDASMAVALALRDWLPNVIQTLQPWVSSEDIEKGTSWLQNVSGRLNECRVGIICLTPFNLTAPWILFEAGALSKAIAEKAHVCTFLLGVKNTDVKFPLAQFQATEANKSDTLKMMQTINKAVGEPLNEAAVVRQFDKWWGDLEEQLKAIELTGGKAIHAQRPDRELLEEILALVRNTSRQTVFLPVQSTSEPDQEISTIEADLVAKELATKRLADHVTAIEGEARTILNSDSKFGSDEIRDLQRRVNDAIALQLAVAAMRGRGTFGENAFLANLKSRLLHLEVRLTKLIAIDEVAVSPTDAANQ